MTALNRAASDLAREKLRDAPDPGRMAMSLIFALFRHYAEHHGHEAAAVFAHRLCRYHERLGARLFIREGRAKAKPRVFSPLASKPARPVLSLPKEAA